ncbi:MAG TPA: hypothetical protein VG520_04385 [Candidatus Dormibacteraeota bacterium]|nr:hypothetical protein [Candidatus Dormibacteraeota bacterium]
MSEHVRDDEPYLLVEEVAERLGLPLSVLLHRVEAGDIPAQRIESEEGVHYALRLGDLGIELDDQGLRSSAIGDDGGDSFEGSTGEEALDEESTLSSVFSRDDTTPSVAHAIVSAFNSGPEPLPRQRLGSLNVTGRRVDDEDVAVGVEAASDRQWSDPDALEPVRETELPRPAWSGRPREPQEAPSWLTPRSAAAEVVANDPVDDPIDGSQGAAEVADAGALDVAETAGVSSIDDDPVPPPAHPSLHAERDGVHLDEEGTVAQLAMPPPPSPSAQVGILGAASPGPHGDLASMSLDARELVAGLLDRWERTLEQRIYTEQRQRFQTELVARQNMVKQLQMELHSARAEHAAAQAEKDRVLAEKERELADRERDLAESRRLAQEAERVAVPAASHRRRWFWNRDD